MYESLHDVEQKLYHSIILYDGHPVYVHKMGLINEDGDGNGMPTLTLAPVPQAKKLAGTFTVTVKDQKLNFRGISSRLGYLSWNFDCIWLCRIAQRKSVQGLNQENLQVPYLPTSTRLARPMQTISFTEATKSEAFFNMILGIYPSIKEAKSLLDSTHSGVPFTRDLALTKREILDPYGLEYKGDTIGETDNCKSFSLYKKFHYLGEILEHQGLAFHIQSPKETNNTATAA